MRYVDRHRPDLRLAGSAAGELVAYWFAEEVKPLLRQQGLLR